MVQANDGRPRTVARAGSEFQQPEDQELLRFVLELVFNARVLEGVGEPGAKSDRSVQVLAPGKAPPAQRDRNEVHFPVVMVTKVVRDVAFELGAQRAFMRFAVGA